MATYEFFQHMTSGDIFAVALDGEQQVMASIGPLYRDDLHYTPAEFARNMEVEDNEWFNEGNNFRLLEAAEALQRANR